MPQSENLFAFISNLRGWELLIILFAILLLFGAKKLPELAKGIGKSMKEFKKAATEAEESFKTAIDTETPQPATVKTTTDTQENKEASAPTQA